MPRSQIHSRSIRSRIARSRAFRFVQSMSRSRWSRPKTRSRCSPSGRCCSGCRIRRSRLPRVRSRLTSPSSKSPCSIRCRPYCLV